jgi:hypothetical protein
MPELFGQFLRLSRIEKIRSFWLGRRRAQSLQSKDRPLAVARHQDVSASKAKKVIADYKKAIGRPEGLAELMVFYCERASDFSNAFGFADEAYFGALLKMFEQALKISITLPIDQRDAVLDRLDDVRSISHNFGYGVGDEMDILLAEYKNDA